MIEYITYLKLQCWINIKQRKCSLRCLTYPGKFLTTENCFVILNEAYELLVLQRYLFYFYIFFITNFSGIEFSSKVSCTSSINQKLIFSYTLEGLFSLFSKYFLILGKNYSINGYVVGDLKNYYLSTILLKIYKNFKHLIIFDYQYRILKLFFYQQKCLIFNFNF